MRHSEAVGREAVRMTAEWKRAPFARNIVEYVNRPAVA